MNKEHDRKIPYGTNTYGTRYMIKNKTKILPYNGTVQYSGTGTGSVVL